MSYSCAYFEHEDDSLEDAQYQKVHHILDKLYLKEGMTLLDIGCGWGFLLIEAARKYGVKGYGCTLSEEQWKKGQERIKEFGLEGQVEIELIDYRDVAASGRTFDRIVSVGMLEHVGRPNFPLYMEDASTMLMMVVYSCSITSVIHQKKNLAHGFVNISSQVDAYHLFVKLFLLLMTMILMLSMLKACACTTIKH